MRRAAALAAAALIVVLAVACGDDDSEPGAADGDIDLATTEAQLTITLAPGDFQTGWPDTITSGDFNDDGATDLLIGAPFADGPDDGRQDGGEAYVLFGPLSGSVDLSNAADTAGVVVLGAELGDNLGGGVAAGDLNGDGIDDIVVGAPASNGLVDIRTDMGEAYVIFGRSSLGGAFDILEQVQDLTVQPAEGYSALGRAFAIGDLNDDGIDDLVMGAPYAGRIPNTPPGGTRTTVGEVYVVYGASDLGGTITIARDQDDLRLTGDNQYDQFGGDVGLADVNGDGMLDIIVAASGYDGAGGEAAESGGVFVFFGADDPPDRQTGSDADVTISGAAGYTLGTGITASDLDGDGSPEIAASAPSAPTAVTPEPGVGRLYFVHTLATTAATIDLEVCDCADVLYGAAAGEFFPASLVSSRERLSIAAGSPPASSGELAGNGIVTLLRAGDGVEGVSDASLRVLGAATGDGLGTALSFVDLDGDGESELLVQAVAADGSHAAIYGISLTE